MSDLLERYKKDKQAVLDSKKSAIKYADANGGYYTPNLDKGYVAKSEPDQDNGVSNKTIVGNTYNWFDSHGDVHVKGCFKDSIENDMTPLHLKDHEFKVMSQIGDVQSVKEQKMAWKTLGVDKDGYTTVLLLNSDVKKEYDEDFYKMYNNGRINQHSVGMRYVELALAVNSEEKWAAEEKATWDEYFDKVANNDQIKNHFWVVKEAKLIEVSAVLRGSNTLTPTIKMDVIEIEDKGYSIKDIRKSLDFLN